MIVVAICRFASTGAQEQDGPLETVLARETGIAVYDARLKLAQPPPIVALRTANADAAQALLRTLRARGHEAVACDEDGIAPLTPVRAFRFQPTSFEREGDAVAYDDIVALVRAARPLRVETTERVTERKLRPGAAIITGGLIMSKKVTRDEKRVAHDKEELLYVFARSGAAWLVSERGTLYGSLDGVAPTQRANFMRVVGELRARAPGAVFDERLLAHRGIESRDIDLRARLIAMAAQRSMTSLPNASKT